MKNSDLKPKLIGALLLLLLLGTGIYLYQTRDSRDPTRLVYHDSETQSSEYFFLPGDPTRLLLSRTSRGRTDDSVALELVEAVPGPKPVFRRQPVATLRQKKGTGCVFAQLQDGQWFQFQTEVLGNYRNGILLAQNSEEEADEAEVEFTLSKMVSAKTFQEIRRWKVRGDVHLFPHRYWQRPDGLYGHCGCSTVVRRIDYQGKETLFPSQKFDETASWSGKLLVIRKSEIPGDKGETKPGPDWTLLVLEPGAEALTPLAELPKFRLPGDPELFDDNAPLIFPIRGKIAVCLTYAGNDYLAYPEGDGSLKCWRKDPWGTGSNIRRELIPGPDGEHLVAYEEIVDSTRSHSIHRLRLVRLDLKTGRRYQAELDENTCPSLKLLRQKMGSVSPSRGSWLQTQCFKFGLYRLGIWLNGPHWWDRTEDQTNSFSGITCMPAPDFLVLGFNEYRIGNSTSTQKLQRIDWRELSSLEALPDTPVPTAKEFAEEEKRREKEKKPKMGIEYVDPPMSVPVEIPVPLSP